MFGCVQVITCCACSITVWGRKPSWGAVGNTSGSISSVSWTNETSGRHWPRRPIKTDPLLPGSSWRASWMPGHLDRVFPSSRCIETTRQEAPPSPRYVEGHDCVNYYLGIKTKYIISSYRRTICGTKTKNKNKKCICSLHATQAVFAAISEQLSCYTIPSHMVWLCFM
jgi:hypothetical protein